MLLGRMPGDTVSDLFAVLPSYGTLTRQYLDRFGSYRLQPYAIPAAPHYSAPRPVPAVPSLPVMPPTAAKPGQQFGQQFVGGRNEGGRTMAKAFDPVGVGPGALTGYDRAIAFGDALANPQGFGIGFSNPSLGGLAGLAIREIAEATRRGAVARINEARLKGLINDANRRVAPGTPIGRGGGLGTPEVGGLGTISGGLARGLTNGQPQSAGAGKTQSASARQSQAANARQSQAADRSVKGAPSNRGPGSRGSGSKDHYGGPR